MRQMTTSQKQRAGYQIANCADRPTKSTSKRTKEIKTPGRRKVHKVMKEYKEGTLQSGSSDKKVTSRKQTRGNRVE